jgi:hypothetical protein
MPRPKRLARDLFGRQLRYRRDSRDFWLASGGTDLNLVRITVGAAAVNIISLREPGHRTFRRHGRAHRIARQ